jgi:TonB family protein
VLTEVTIGVDGGVTNTEVVQAADGFDEVALGAAHQWSFRPARVNGRFEETFAYIAFAFRTPITGERVFPIEPPQPEKPRPEEPPQ